MMKKFQNGKPAVLIEIGNTYSVYQRTQHTFVKVTIFAHGKDTKVQAESVLLLKTAVQAYDELERFIIEVHSYYDPCVLKLPIESGATDFMSWIKNTVIS